MKVQLLYFNGCPNWKVAEERLRHALDVLEIPAVIDRCLVETDEVAGRLRFAGSPSILLNGRDPFRSASSRFGLTCRVYDTPDGPEGAPTLIQLVEAVKKAAAA